VGRVGEEEHTGWTLGVLLFLSSYFFLMRKEAFFTHQEREGYLSSSAKPSHTTVTFVEAQKRLFVFFKEFLPPPVQRPNGAS